MTHMPGFFIDGTDAVSSEELKRICEQDVYDFYMTGVQSYDDWFYKVQQKHASEIKG